MRKYLNQKQGEDKKDTIKVGQLEGLLEVVVPLLQIPLQDPEREDFYHDADKGLKEIIVGLQEKGDGDQQNRDQIPEIFLINEGETHNISNIVKH